jgi:hypothetical protein
MAHASNLPYANTEKIRRIGRAWGAVTLLAGSQLGCAADAPPAKDADTAVAAGGSSYQLGAPRDTHYKADIEAQRGRIRVVVRQESVCDVIPIHTVVEQGETKWVAGNPTTTKECDAKFARNVMLSLDVNGNTFRLGEPNAFGEVQTDLADRMLQNLYGEDTTKAPLAHVMLRDRQGRSQEIGTVDLTQLSAANRRLDELLAEFRSLLDRPQQTLSGAELVRSYELYEQLGAYDSMDPRIGALQAMFMERLYQRKADEATDRFKKNLEALNVAKEILKTNRSAIVLPGYVLTALDAGTPDARTVDWARGQVALALRHSPSLCGEKGKAGFTWARLQLSPPPPQSRLAFEVLRFAYDNPYEREISALCERVVL